MLKQGGPPQKNQLRLVAWEVTRRCNLNCIHCRAASGRGPYAGEFDTTKCIEILDEISAVGSPIVILTGGEPLLREDIFDLARYGTAAGLRMVMATNGSLLTPEIIEKINSSGIKRVSISIDGADQAQHDQFRMVEGAFEKSINGVKLLKEAGIEFQINTTVTRHNIHNIGDILNISVGLGAEAHHLFLLVPTGRAKEMTDQEIGASEYEQLLHWFYQMRDKVPLHLKATCAPHYYRILRQEARSKGEKVTFETYGLDAMTRGCLGGTSFCFISYDGIVQPCGYLELNCGDLRHSTFSSVWQGSEKFNQLRDFSSYKGKCGRCEYIRYCGGCRARAYEATGDFLAEEPLCVYEPKRQTMNETDKRILNEIQTDFPLTNRPFHELGKRLGLSESEVIERVRKLKDKGVIRRIGGNFHSNKLNFASTLCAAKVPEWKVEHFVQVVNLYPGVTHNYLRNHDYNIWFTFIAEDMDTICNSLEKISAETGVTQIRNLPATKTFKIKVDFEV